MSNTRVRLKSSAFVMSSLAVQQLAKDSFLFNNDLDSRERCTVSVSDVVTETVIKDCENVFTDDIVVKTQYKQFTLNYASVTPQILAKWAAYFFGATASPTGTNASEVQTLARTGSITGGTFTLSVTLEGRTGTTAAIPYTATNAEIQSALTKKGASIEQIIKNGDVIVTGNWTSGIVVTFAGRLAGADMPLLVVGNGGLIGSSPNISVTGTTAGSSKYFPFVRATSDEKPLFGFALVDINSAIAAEKYGNAVCGSFNVGVSAGGDVTLQVTVLCDYEPEDVTGFPVPPCVNYPPLTASDCRVKINGAWETLDVFTESINLNDNLVPDFGFDSAVPDVVERGDSPEYAITGQIYGVKSDPFGIIVENRQKAEFITHFGMPGNRFSIIAPQTYFKPSNNSRQFAGPRNARVISFDGVPTRDGANAPVRGEYYGSQTQSFLQIDD